MATILIADDDIQVREFLVRTLMKGDAGHTLLTAVNGQQALEITEEIIPDLIIIDWEMPVMNGIEAVKKWKEQERTNAIPVIMCTGVMTDSVSLGTAFGAGVIDFLRKPANETELLARVNAMLRYQSLQQQKHETELRYKQQEISNYVLQLTQKNDFLEKIKEQLVKLENDALRPVISSIEFNIDNATWSDLNMMVGKVEPGFLERLALLAPDLTPYDIRLCSLIRLRLSIKEAAQLMNISHDSMMKSRYRLKKKLSPDSELSLEQIVLAV